MADNGSSGKHRNSGSSRDLRDPCGRAHCLCLVDDGLAATREIDVNIGTAIEVDHSYQRFRIMRDDSQASTSIWMATADTPSQIALERKYSHRCLHHRRGHRRLDDCVSARA